MQQMVIKMKKNNIRLLLYIIIIPSFYSCNKKTEYLSLLLNADSIMASNVDSAYYLLCSINDTELYNNEEKAFYSLLITQAKDKKMYFHINDSLITIAVNNYKQKSKSYLYLETVSQKNNNLSQAIDAYLKALNTTTNNHITQIQTYDNLAECYGSQNIFYKALEMHENSYTVNKKGNNSTKIIHPIQGLANLYLIKEDVDKAISYYKQALRILNKTNGSIWESTIFWNMARLFHNQKKNDKAYKYIIKALENTASADDLSAITFWKDKILLNIDEYDSAFNYLTQASISKDIYAQAASFQAFYELRRKQCQYKKSIAYNDKALILYDSIQGYQYQKNINEILKEHALAMYQQEQKNIHTKQTAILCIFSLLSITAIITIFMHINNHKIRIGLQQELMKVISDKNEFKERLKRLSLKNENKEMLQKSLIEQWKQTMQICKRLFQTTDSFKKINYIEKNKYIPNKLQKKGDIKYIRTEIKSSFAEAIQNLQELYPSLTQDDMLFCILRYLKLSNNTVKICMEIASSPALTQRKYRIKKQLTKPVLDYIFGTLIDEK